MNIKNFMKCCDKGGVKIPKQQLVIFNNLLKRFMNLFEFENVDETINLRDLMLSIIFNDSYMILEIDGVLRNVYGGLAGDLDFYGYPTRYLWSTGVQSGDNAITDGVVGHSNSLWTPLAPTLLYYSKMLAGLDTSLDIASVNTRLTPVYRATTDTERQQVESVFNAIKNGEQKFVCMHKTTLKELADENGNYAIDLTGASGDHTYIPMLLQAYDNILARVCRELGINITTQMKRAQVISAELNGYENYTQIFLDDMLKCIRQAFDEVNARWGREWKVRLSVAFIDDNPVDVGEDLSADSSADSSADLSAGESAGGDGKEGE